VTVARITASVYTSHVPAIGAAMDLGKDKEPYWQKVFAGYDFSRQWIKGLGEGRKTRFTRWGRWDRGRCWRKAQIRHTTRSQEQGEHDNGQILHISSLLHG